MPRRVIRKRIHRRRRVCPGCPECCSCPECQIGCPRGPSGPQGDHEKCCPLEQSSNNWSDMGIDSERENQIRGMIGQEAWILDAIMATKPEFRQKLLRIMQDPEIQAWMSKQPAYLTGPNAEINAMIYPTLGLQFGDGIVMALGDFYEQLTKRGGRPVESNGYDAEKALYQSESFLDYILNGYQKFQDEFEEFRRWTAQNSS